jgi:hypothetical protein
VTARRDEGATRDELRLAQDHGQDAVRDLRAANERKRRALLEIGSLLMISRAEYSDDPEVRKAAVAMWREVRDATEPVRRTAGEG